MINARAFLLGVGGGGEKVFYVCQLCEFILKFRIMSKFNLNLLEKMGHDSNTILKQIKHNSDTC